MNVEQTKRTIKGLPAKRSILIRSRHGLGKSEVVRQVCAELSQTTGKPHIYTDIRLSQREAGDVIGLPRVMETFSMQQTTFVDGRLEQQAATIKNCMIHDLPMFFPRDPNAYGILHLDEIDRACREVQQCAFELVLDRRLNGVYLPENIRVVACINGDQDIYSVLQLDPALLDRFVVVDFKPTVPEWMTHAESIGVHDAIVKYLTKFGSDLDTPENIESGKVYQSRRSWVALSNDIQHMASNGADPLKDLDYLTLLSGGYIGVTTAINFVEFIRKEYKVFSPEDILDKWDREMAEDFSKSHPAEVAFYTKELVKYISKEKVKLTKKQQVNLTAFLKAIPKESASGFWSHFSTQCREQATQWYKDKEVSEYITALIFKSEALK
jgi:MoxR-like ATPase